MKSTRRLLKGLFTSEIGSDTDLDQTKVECVFRAEFRMSRWRIVQPSGGRTPLYLVERIFVVRVVIFIICWKIRADFRYKAYSLNGHILFELLSPCDMAHVSHVIWHKRSDMGGYESFFLISFHYVRIIFGIFDFLWTVLTQTNPNLTTHVCFSKVQWSKSCRDNSFTNLSFPRCSSVTSFVFKQLLWFLLGISVVRKGSWKVWSWKEPSEVGKNRAKLERFSCVFLCIHGTLKTK